MNNFSRRLALTTSLLAAAWGGAGCSQGQSNEREKTTGQPDPTVLTMPPDAGKLTQPPRTPIKTYGHVGRIGREDNGPFKNRIEKIKFCRDHRTDPLCKEKPVYRRVWPPAPPGSGNTTLPLRTPEARDPTAPTPGLEQRYKSLFEIKPEKPPEQEPK